MSLVIELKCETQDCSHPKFTNPLVYMHCSDLRCPNFIDKCVVHQQ